MATELKYRAAAACLALASHAAAADTDFSSELIALALDGDFGTAERVLDYWARTQPRDEMLEPMRKAITAWRQESVETGSPHSIATVARN